MPAAAPKHSGASLAGACALNGSRSKLAASVTALPPAELLNGLASAPLVRFGEVWKAKTLLSLFAALSYCCVGQGSALLRALQEPEVFWVVRAAFIGLLVVRAAFIHRGTI